MARGSFGLTLLLVCFALKTVAGQDLSKFPNIRGQDLGKNKYAIRVKDCYLKEKTDFEGCLFKFWQEVSPLLKTGIADLHVPSLDPLFIDNVSINERLGTVKGEFKLTDIIVVGVAGITPVHVKVDTKAKLVTLTIKFPYLNSTGNYTVNGEVLLMPVKGKGVFQLDLSNVNAVVKLHVGQKGTGIMVNKVELDFTIENIFVKVQGLFGDDSVNQSINNMLNENAQVIMTDVKPVVSKKFEEIFFALTKDAFIDVPPDAFIA